MDAKSIVSRVLAPSEDEMPLFVGLAVFTLVVLANGFEHIGGVTPCALCLDQRKAHYAVMLACGLTWFLYRHPQTKGGPGPRVASVLITLALAYGFYLAAFHAGVEQGWWEGPASCTKGGAGTISLDELLSENTAVVMCDEIPWSLFGISLAGYNALATLVLLVYSVFPQARRLKKNGGI